MSDWTGVTGSGAFDAEACPARVAFPQADSHHEPAEAGVVLHRFCQLGTLNPARRPDFLEDVPEKYRARAAGINLDEALEGIEIRTCEISYAINVKERTCRLIGTNIDRRYNETLIAKGEPPLSLYEIPFTIDLEGKSTELGIPVELDYKTGFSIGEVEEHGQRKIHSAGLMFFHGTSSAISRVAYIRQDGQIWHDGHEFTIFDAYEACDALVKMVDRVVAAKAKVAAGIVPEVYADRERQCRFCNAFVYCPYWTNLPKAVAGKVPELQKLDLEQTSPEELGRIFDHVKDVLKLYGEIEDKLKERVHRGALPVSDEWEFRVNDKNGRAYFDAAAARGLLVTVLQKLGESEDEIKARIVKLTKQGKPIQEVRKMKRQLPVITKRKAS